MTFYYEYNTYDSVIEVAIEAAVCTEVFIIKGYSLTECSYKGTVQKGVLL